ncbi:unnamed protein product [Camellia sinensis]
MYDTDIYPCICVSIPINWDHCFFLSLFLLEFGLSISFHLYQTPHTSEENPLLVTGMGKLISFLFRSLGLGDFLEPDIAWPARPDCSSEPHSVSAILIRELLPVVQFSDLVDPPESCAVCLYDFDGGDEIRRLTNCRHIFHRSCLDRWMDHDHRTCPLCRTLFIPDDLQDVFTARLWAASGISDYYGEYSPITAGLQEAGPHSIWWFDLRGNNIIIFSLLSFPPTILEKGGQKNKGGRWLFLLALMAGPDDQPECKKTQNISTIIASEGVEFLLRGEEKVPLSSDGKTTCLYFSANWCRPCKSFTPQLVQLYNQLTKLGKKIEIIFISFDRDEEGFKEHFNCMPWLAVPFDVNLHRRLSNHYHIDHIPSFIPLGSDGMSMEEDAAALIADYGTDAFPFTRERREELKAMDDAKRLGGKLEELLAYEGRNYLISGHGRVMWVSELVGKTVGLYFGAHWCPPCRAFTAQLTEAYNELLLTAPYQSFEIVFISTDRDSKEFDLHVRNMPWLAIPYEEDKTRQDLCRIFDIKKIPALVLVGPDGKTISTNGRPMVSLYGARAFPFTQRKIAELEADMRKEGDGLPHHVKDPKHEHVLKLDMAKAYVCDFCRKHGRIIRKKELQEKLQQLRIEKKQTEELLKAREETLKMKEEELEARGKENRKKELEKKDNKKKGCPQILWLKDQWRKSKKEKDQQPVFAFLAFTTKAMKLLEEKQKEKDPLKSKQPMSALFMFKNERRAALLAKSKTVWEVAKTTCEEWKNMTEKQKKPYEKIAKQNKGKYLEGMEAYKQRKEEEFAYNVIDISLVEKRLVEEVKSYGILIIVGETGNGKTTRKFLFNAGFCRDGKIIGITQTRRIATVSVAKRVAEECSAELGQKVGYSVRFDDMTFGSTRIKYMTDGFLLREALLDPYLSRYAVIIVDEAHERTVHTDVLLGLLKSVQNMSTGILKQYQGTKFSPLKLIIMSASLDAQIFSEYFGSAKVVHVQVRQFLVDILYTYHPETDCIDAALITIIQIHSEEGPGDILVFLTGQEEIEYVEKLVQESLRQLPEDNQKLKVLPIFSSLPSEKQIQMFMPPPTGFRNVILATNIAETSVTILGIKYVIDPGLMKACTYRACTTMESLIFVPTSKAQALQRSGCEGPGKCFRLYPEIEFEKLRDSTILEITRCNLSNIILQLKALGVDDIFGFDFMEKPSRDAVIKSLEILVLLDAITEEYKLSDPIGHQMAQFPLKPIHSKALILASQFNCMEEMLITVAMLSVESIFYAPCEKL